MGLPGTTFLWNNTANDGVNSGGASGGAGGSSSNWVVMDRTNDVIYFLDSQQTDGDSMSGTIYPVIIPSVGSSESSKTFIKDNSLSIFDQVPLSGTTAGGQSGGNTRYVFAIFVSGETATTPYLEAWDTNAHSTSAKAYLGSGTAANSTIKAVATTLTAPGSATWSGTGLAGTGSRISLFSGAVSGETNLYFNIKQVIPSTFTAETDSTIVLTMRFTYS